MNTHFEKLFQHCGDNSTWSEYDFAQQFYIAGLERAAEIIDNFSCPDRKHLDCGHSHCEMVTEQLELINEELTQMEEKE